MSEELYFDYGFINKFNELSSEEKKNILKEILALPMDSQAAGFSKINVSEYFDEADLKTDSEDIRNLINEVFKQKLGLPQYREARNFIHMVGQTRNAPIAGFNIKNEPIVYHIYKTLTTRSLKRDLNFQQAIYNDPQKTIIAPLAIDFDEIWAHMENGMDIRVEIDDLLADKTGAFMVEDGSIIAVKILLYMALRGYLGTNKTFAQIWYLIPEKYRHFDEEIYGTTFPFAHHSEEGITPIVDNDDRNRLELGWMIAYIRFHLNEASLVRENVRPLLKELSVFDSKSDIEAHRYLADIYTAFAIFSN